MVKKLLWQCVMLAVLCSCAIGPDYKRPDVTDITPPDWHWKIAEPNDSIPKGEWWKLFKDPALDELESGAVANNQNLRAAVARIDQSRAFARLTRSQFFRNYPSIPPSAGSGLPPTSRLRSLLLSS